MHKQRERGSEMVKAWIRDHTVVIDLPRSCFLVRPALSWDGTCSFNGNCIPWFKRKVLQSKSGGTLWNFFAIPYICFGIVRFSEQSNARLSGDRKTV